MPRVNITNQDLLRSKLLPPKWYDILVKSLEVGQASTDGSALYIFHLEVEDKEFAGVPLRHQISEKAIGMAMPLLVACGWKAQAGSVEFNDCVGKHLQCFVQRGEYNGRPQNQVADFRAKPQQATS